MGDCCPVTGGCVGNKPVLRGCCWQFLVRGVLPSESGLSPCPGVKDYCWKECMMDEMQTFLHFSTFLHVSTFSARQSTWCSLHRDIGIPNKS